jgi:hypothetical protein
VYKKILDKLWRKTETIAKILSIFNGIIIVTWATIARGKIEFHFSDFILLFCGMILLPLLFRGISSSLRAMMWENNPRTFDFTPFLRNNRFSVKYGEQDGDLIMYDVVDENDELIFIFTVAAKLNIIVNITYGALVTINGENAIGQVNHVLRSGDYSAFAIAKGLINGKDALYIDVIHAQILQNLLHSELVEKGVGTKKILFKLKL